MRPVYVREESNAPRRSWVCYSCGFGWTGHPGQCPDCGRPTVTLDKRTGDERRPTPAGEKSEGDVTCFCFKRSDGSVAHCGCSPPEVRQDWVRGAFATVDVPTDWRQDVVILPGRVWDRLRPSEPTPNKEGT